MTYDILIKNGIVFDGTGNRPVKLDIGIKNGKVIKMGKLQKESADNEINAKNQYVSPGFIDINNDSDHYLSVISSPSSTSFFARNGSR